MAYARRMQADLERRLRRLGRRGHRAVVAGVVRGGQRASCCRLLPAQPVDERSLFEIGSITKAFTGVLLADMVLRGDVALEDPLSRHLPGRHPTWRYRQPTLLELATHRSGLANAPRAMSRRDSPTPLAPVLILHGII
jgi:serine-type D-Ala-D-Ala carboxypeptidase/endopeptidase